MLRKDRASTFSILFFSESYKFLRKTKVMIFVKHGYEMLLIIEGN